MTPQPSSMLHRVHEDCSKWPWLALEPLETEDLTTWPVWLMTGAYVDDTWLTPLPPAAATPCFDSTSNGEKRLRPKQITEALRFWLERFHTPYATLTEKKRVAETLKISVVQVTNFCISYRERFYAPRARVFAHV
jgi:hypothetical protein